MKLGLVTYNVAKDWDLPTILDRVNRAGWEGVELRTEHAHGVEIDLDAGKRREVRQRFADAGVTLWALGTTCEFHSPDAATVAANVEQTRRWCELAEAVGAWGVKVRPNGLPKEEEISKTLERIGSALRDCGSAADDHEVEIFVEVHGGGTQNPPNMRTLLDHCRHPRVGVCWNSNPTDLLNGSIEAAFDLLAPAIRSCHINQLWDTGYPYRDLFARLQKMNYVGFTLCEIGTPFPPESSLPFLNCYRGLWAELRRPAF